MPNLRRGLIVSCQAVKGEPLYGLGIMKYFARAAVLGGAAGIRANYVADIVDIKSEVDVPIIGIIKEVYEDNDVYITPTLKEVKALLGSGCEVVALDCTGRKRPHGERLEDLVDYVRRTAPNVELMADCSDYDDAVEAHRLGFDYIGSTMRGYTPKSKGAVVPDIDFLKKLVDDFGDECNIVAEGGIWEGAQLKAVCETGVYAVVIGSAITRPMDITKHFAEVMKLC